MHIKYFFFRLELKVASMPVLQSKLGKSRLEKTCFQGTENEVLNNMYARLLFFSLYFFSISVKSSPVQENFIGYTFQFSHRQSVETKIIMVVGQFLAYIVHT